MQQDTSYPDPEQLKTWAGEMVPFTGGVSPGSVMLTDDGYLSRTDVEDTFEVEYQYRPTYINVETAQDEWHRADDVSWADIDHEQAWDRAMNVEWGEDFISVTGMCPDPDQPAQFDAYWILETTTVTRHEA